MKSILLAAAVVLTASTGGPRAMAQAQVNPTSVEVKVLARGAAVHGANGIRFDRSDRLHIASLWGNEILVMDTLNGKILQRIGSDKGVSTPDDLVFGPDGSLYWASMLGAAVGRLAPDGTSKTQAVAAGTNPIAISADGRLVVGLYLLGDGLYELDPALTAAPKKLDKPAGGLNGFDFGPDKLLYTPLPFEGRVVRFNPWASPIVFETVLDKQAVPSAVKFSPSGWLYGPNQVSGELWRLDPLTKTKETVANLPPGTDNLAFDSSGRLFVSHANDGTIFEVQSDGQVRTVSPGGMILPGGVAVMPREQGGESVFVADLWTLREFNGPTGSVIGSQAFSFTDPAGLTAPFTVSRDGSNLIVSTVVTNLVQIWNPDTKSVVKNYADFAVPVNAIRFQGDIVVSELGTHSVVRVTDTGRTTITDALFYPTGLAAIGDDLYVADWGSGMIWKIISQGVAVKVPVAKGLAGPEGLAADRDGNLLVVESRAGKLWRINMTTGEASLVAGDLELGAAGSPGMPPAWAFNGVAVGVRDIYVTGDKTNVLYRIQENRAPVAVAEPLNLSTVQREAQLDGSKSTDPDGDVLTYSWRSIGKTAALIRADTAKPTVQLAEGIGEYVFELTVTDPRGASSTAIARVQYFGR